MTHFKLDEFGTIKTVMFGGPLDGNRYMLPLLPPDGGLPAGISIPLKQPADTSPYAVYERAAQAPVDDVHAFLFVECRGPNDEPVLYAPDFTNDAPNTVLDVASVEVEVG